MASSIGGGHPGETETAPKTFGSWLAPPDGFGAWVVLEVTLDPSGTTDAVVEIGVDESGGEAADYTLAMLAAAGLGANPPEARTFYVPPGGSYRVRNVSDPNGSNSFDVHRRVVL